MKGNYCTRAFSSAGMKGINFTWYLDAKCTIVRYTCSVVGHNYKTWTIIVPLSIPINGSANIY
jgi:hypothetical protein